MTREWGPLSGKRSGAVRLISCRMARRFFCICCGWLIGLSGSFADNGWEGQILSLTWENDAIVNRDKHYTQGAKIAYLSSDDSLPNWVDHLSRHIPALGLNTQAQKFGLAVGQEIYTPGNLQAANLITNDRPYAGWLYASVALQRRGLSPAALPVTETFRLDLGVIGPESLAEAAQKQWHGVAPKGWGNQLKTEPGLALRYQRDYLFSAKWENGWGYDIIPGFGGSAGNVATSLNLDSVIRAGYGIPNEFEVPLHPTPTKFGAYLFTGVEGRYVARDLFLDGNTFRAGPHVDKKPWVGDWRAGVTMVVKNVELTAAVTYRSKEFNGQTSGDSFGTAMLTIKF